MKQKMMFMRFVLREMRQYSDGNGRVKREPFRGGEHMRRQAKSQGCLLLWTIYGVRPNGNQQPLMDFAKKEQAEPVQQFLQALVRCAKACQDAAHDIREYLDGVWNGSEEGWASVEYMLLMATAATSSPLRTEESQR